MAEPMPDERRAAIRAREQAATPGPWAQGGTNLHPWEVTISRKQPFVELPSDAQGEADAAFIAHARQDLADLLAEVELLREANAAAETARIESGQLALKEVELAQRAEAERDQLKALTATCSCGTPGMDYEGPQADCPVHGAIRGLQEAQAERDRYRKALELIGTRCENFTKPSTCVDDPARSPDAEYGAYRWCVCCVSRTALNPEAPSEATR